MPSYAKFDVWQNTAGVNRNAILQVVQVVKTNTVAGAPGALWADVPGMAATITPSSTTSRILIIVDMKGAGTTDNTTVRSRLLRDSTPIYFGDAAGSRPLGMAEFYIAGGGGPYYTAQLGGSFVDSPATISAVTYKMQFGSDGNANVVYINRTQGDRDAAYVDARIASSIILMEIAG